MRKKLDVTDHRRKSVQTAVRVHHAAVSVNPLQRTEAAMLPRL